MTSPTASTEFTPYSSAVPFFSRDFPWVVNEDDKERIKAYELYSKMYWNEPGWCELAIHGDSAKSRPIYLPSFSKIVEATNRFLGLDFGFVLNEQIGSAEQRNSVTLQLNSFFKREQIKSKFGRTKRGTLIKGDYIWHQTANPLKKQGSRISVQILDPSAYFPIYDDLDSNRLIGCHLVEVISDPRDDENKKTIVKRQTYRKTDDDKVTSELSYWELEAWDDRNLEPGDLKKVTDSGLEEWSATERNLGSIPVLPVYHFKNVVWDDHPFGISEGRGMENAIAAINQTITDEDLTLVMQGLGMYWTNAGPPTDSEGNETSLAVAPGELLELPQGSSIGRLTGVSSIAPMLDHMNHIYKDLEVSRGVSDIAAGRVDVAVAESGISLYLQLAPMLSKNAEKEMDLGGVIDNWLFDLLNYWLPEYEQFEDGKFVEASYKFKDPVPVNRAATITEVIGLYAANLITTEMAIARLAELGWKYPPNAAKALLDEAAARIKATTPVDPYAERSGEERDGGEEDQG